MTSVMTTHLVNWFSPNVLHALGWALLHFLWQGTAVAALAAAAMAVCRSASIRYVVGVSALILILASPVATFFYYAQQNSNQADITQFSSVVAVVRAARNTTAIMTGMRPYPQSRSSEDALPLLVEAWLLGVAFFSLRSVGGFMLLERNRRQQSSAVSQQLLHICRAMQRRLGLSRSIAFRECTWLHAPAVIGWFRPVVFLPASALTGLSQDQLRSVIAHELAHIRRFDPFVNVFQIWVETLLFYHPAVWWLNQRIRADREYCCDEIAVSVGGNRIEYARALTIMEEWRSAPALVMAANRGPLTERIVRVLGLNTVSSGIRSIGVSAGMLCLSAAPVAVSALLGIAPPKAHAFFAQVVPRAFVNPDQASSDAPTPTPVAAPTPAATPRPAQKPSPARPPANEHPKGSYIDDMKAAGLGELTVDQLVALKIHGVSPDYVRELHEQGVNLEPNEIIAMKVQDVTPDYIRGLRAAGLNPGDDQIIAMKVQGVDPQYFKGLTDAGVQADVNRLIALKVQGVTPEYVRELQAAGLKMSTDQIIALKVQGVSPSYLKQLHEQGVDPRTDDAIAMRIQGVTPEYVREIHAAGLKPSTSELIAMRIQDVTPEYVKALQAAGFNFNVREVISAKIQDVTPEFIERVRRHGFKDLTLNKLIQLRQLGILDSKADL
jgi:beta-lactamase regulating signal transducer with metallopeptidase domain/predicted flap endonuclease-1-like 5' DNA nuclease